MEEHSTVQGSIPTKVVERAKEWASLNIETNELLFVLLSFADAKLTTLCLNIGGLEATPWMRGWGANAALRMAVATSIMLYLKMRDQTKLLWFGVAVLFVVVVWNCCMLLLLYFNGIDSFSQNLIP